MVPSIRANDLPPYAKRGGDPCFPPPYTVDKAGMDIFICEGDEQALRKMIDQALNQPTELQYGAPGRLEFELADRHVGFACIDVKRLRSRFGDTHQLAAVDRQLAIKGIYARQTEVAVMVQVRDNHGLPYWYLPYVLNSLPTAITTGREIYGYPKQQAQFVPYIPVRGNSTSDGQVLFGLDRRWDKLSVEAFDIGLPGSDGQAEFLSKEVLQFRHGSPGTHAQDANREVPRSDPNNFEFYADHWPQNQDSTPHPQGRVAARAWNGADGTPEMQVSSDSSQLGNRAARDFLFRIRSDVPYVFLRQFRDPQEPTRASYQSLVFGRLIPDSADQLAVVDDHDFTVVMPWAFNLALAEQVFGQEQILEQIDQQPADVERAVVGLLSGRDATFKVLDATVLWEFGSNADTDALAVKMLAGWLARLPATFTGAE